MKFNMTHEEMVELAKISPNVAQVFVIGEHSLAITELQNRVVILKDALDEAYRRIDMIDRAFEMICLHIDPDKTLYDAIRLALKSQPH